MEAKVFVKPKFQVFKTDKHIMLKRENGCILKMYSKKQLSIFYSDINNLSFAVERESMESSELEK